MAFQSFDQRSRFRNGDFGINRLRANLNENREQYFSNLTSSQIKDVYFASAKVFETNGVEIIDDVHVTDLIPRTATFRTDKNRNGYGDPDEPFAFKTKIYVSDDGAKLLKAWNAAQGQVEEFEIQFFMENNVGDSFTKQVLRVAAGSGMAKYFGQASLYRWVNGEFSIDQLGFEALLKEGVNERNVLQQLFDWVSQKYGEAKGFLLDVSIDAMKYITTLAKKNINFQKNNYDNDDENYAPPFLPYEQFKRGNLDIRALVTSAATLPVTLAAFGAGALVDYAPEIIKKARERFAEFDKAFKDNLDGDSYLIPDFLEDLVRRAYAKLSTMIEKILSRLESFAIIFKEFYENYSVLLNGFLCGMINGVIDFVMSIFGLLQLALQGIKAHSTYSQKEHYYNDLALEYLDNLLNAIDKIDWGVVIDRMIPVMKDGFKKMQTFIGAKLDQMSSGTMAYYTGYVIWGIAEFFIPGGVLLKAVKGTATGAKVTSSIVKIVKEVAEAALQIKSKAGQGLQKGWDIFTELIQAMTRMLKKGADALVDFVSKLFDRFRQAALRAYGFTEEVIKIFDQFRIIIVKGAKDAVDAGLAPAYVVNYGAIAIAKGPKEVVEQTALLLKAKGKAAGKYLDDLINYPSTFVINGKKIKFSDELVDFFKQRGQKISSTPRGRHRDKISIVDKDGKILFTSRLKEDIIKFQKLMKMSTKDRAKLIRQVNQVRQKSGLKYDKAAAKAKGYDIPTSKKRKGGQGLSPDFKGKRAYLDNGRVPKIIPPPLKGLTQSIVNEVFEKINKFGGEVRISNTANRGDDFFNAWNKMGIDPTIGEKIRKQFDLTWHHVDDLSADLKATIQLVSREAHEATYSHIGSFSQITELLKLIN